MDWQRVGRYISDRMATLKLTKAEVIDRSGVSHKTLDRYLAGEPIVRGDKARDLCTALGWTVDSIDRIAAGGEPVLASHDEPSVRQEIAELRARFDTFEALLRSMLDRANG